MVRADVVIDGACRASRADARVSRPARRVRPEVSVGAADVPADGARFDAGRRIELEEAGASVGAAEGSAGGIGGAGATPESAHGGRTAGEGRGRGSGHHGCWYSLTFWRAAGSVAAAASWVSALDSPRRGPERSGGPGGEPGASVDGDARPGPSLRTGDQPMMGPVVPSVNRGRRGVGTPCHPDRGGYDASQPCPGAGSGLATREVLRP